MLDVCLPGTGGSVPRLDRFLSCCYMRLDGVGLLIDCGEGTQLAVKKAGFSLGKISTILITHFHADHISGLPGLLLSMGNEGRTEPVLICGPKGIGDIVKGLLLIAQDLPFRIKMQEITDYYTIERDGYTITAFEVKHSKLCYGYDIRVKRGGKFDREKAEKNGVPMKFWSRLQKSETIEGFTPDMVLGETRRGLHVTFATDTRPCEVISMMATDADLLICEGMFEKNKLQRAKESCHMTMTEAAKLAKEADCKQLWLTHYSPSMPEPEQFADEPKFYFENSIVSRDGEKTTLYFED